MLIFTIPGWYKSKKNPENCIFIYEQMQAIRSLGNQVVVLCVHQVPIRSINKADTSIKKEIDNGIITYSTEVNTLYPSKLKTLFTYQFRKSLNKLIIAAKKDYGTPDIYYAHFSFAAGYAASFLNDNVPLVVEEHFSGLMERPDKTLLKILHRTVNHCNSFICVSPGLKKAVIKYVGHHKNLTVVSNMINPCFVYHELPPSKQFVFFSMGSLIPRKRFDFLIEAFSEEFKNDSNIVLRIGGSGKEGKKLKSLIQKNKMIDRILLLGQLSRESTLDEFSKCNCFVLASSAETYGLVYREAMSVGRPIISTRHGGFDDGWSDEFGYLVNIDDKEQLKKALRKMYQNYSNYNLEEISLKCLSTCSSEAVATQIVNVLKKTIDDFKRENEKDYLNN